jgi:hypothetical protein
MNTALTHISVEIPTADVSLLEQMAQRMGWKVGRAVAHKSSIDVSLEEAQLQQTCSFDTVDDLMKDLME